MDAKTKAKVQEVYDNAEKQITNHLPGVRIYQSQLVFEELATLFRGYALANQDQRTLDLIDSYERKYKEVIR
ncbi:hypothetical protein HW132_32000 [Brasilonema sp. CT11]|nr:hypothetical protein [Brasilonema sp. CT11]